MPKVVKHGEVNPDHAQLTVRDNPTYFHGSIIDQDHDLGILDKLKNAKFSMIDKLKTPGIILRNVDTLMARLSSEQMV